MEKANVTKQLQPQQDSPKANILELLKATPVTQIAALPDIAERFKNLYKVIHPGANAEVFYEAEKFHFMKLVTESADLKACTKLSLYGCFLDSAVNGLSFDPTFKHQYMYARSHNLAPKNMPAQWEKRATVNIAGPGELVLRKNQGQILYADNPVLVYEGDDIEFGSKNGNSFVDHAVKLNKRTDRILMAYIKLTRPDNTIDYKWITGEDMARYQAFAKDPKTSKAYGIGIGGMWLAKVLKHSFRNYPKVRMGKFSELQSNTIDEQAEVLSSQMKVPLNLDYGIDQSQMQEGEHDPGAVPGNDGFIDQQQSFTQEEAERFDDPANGQTQKTVTREDDDF